MPGRGCRRRFRAGRSHRSGRGHRRKGRRHPREKVVELLHGAGTEQRARDTRVRDRERHREVGHRQSRFSGERDQPLHRVQAPLITERRHEFRASDVVVLPATDPTGEHALTEWSPDKNAHAVLLRDRKDLTLDAAVQDRVRRLVGTEPLQAAPFRYPVRLYEFEAGMFEVPNARILPLRTRSVSAESVSSISVSRDPGGGSDTRRCGRSGGGAASSRLP
jgi:hypothetical protein